MPVVPAGEGEPVAVLDSAFTTTQAATLPMATSSTPAASVADVGWFVPLPDDGPVAGTEAENVTVASDSSPTIAGDPSVIDAVLAQENFAAASLESGPAVQAGASAGADEYATAVDTLLAEDGGVLTGAI